MTEEHLEVQSLPEVATMSAPNCYCGKAYIPPGAESWLSDMTFIRHRILGPCYQTKEVSVDEEAEEVAEEAPEAPGS